METWYFKVKNGTKADSTINTKMKKDFAKTIEVMVFSTPSFWANSYKLDEGKWISEGKIMPQGDALTGSFISFVLPSKDGGAQALKKALGGDALKINNKAGEEYHLYKWGVGDTIVEQWNFAKCAITSCHDDGESITFDLSTMSYQFKIGTELAVSWDWTSKSPTYSTS
jgi:hypothetical protein